MSTENAKIKVRNRTVEIKWVSEFCDHILDNYINKPQTHDLTFLQILKFMKIFKLFQQKSDRTWYGYNTINDKNYMVVFILTPKFAVIKTCYCYGYEENR